MAVVAPNATEIRGLIRKAKRWDVIFVSLGIACLGIGLLTFATLFLDMLIDGWSRLNPEFFTQFPSRRAGQAGILSAWVGTTLVMLVTAFFAVPLGIGAGVYLEEYAKPSRFNAFIRLNIRNLAGVPSVVYGILGLVVFVQGLDWLTGGRSVISAGITLAILVLPIIIITTAESVSAVPSGLREAGYGVGGTRWETTRDHVLPYAAPGILTGTMLAVARALGEAAPLLLIGAITGRLASVQGQSLVEKMQGKFTTMPIVVYGWANEVNKPGEITGLTFEQLNSAAIVVLLVMVLALNAAAILLRNRFERNRQG